VRLERIIHLAPGASAFCTKLARRSVNLDAFHARQINHEPAVAHGKPGNVVARPPDRYQQVLLTRKIHGLDHIVRADASGNEGRPPIDGDVEDFACAVISKVAGNDKLTTKMRLQLLDCG